MQGFSDGGEDCLWQRKAGTLIRDQIQIDLSMTFSQILTKVMLLWPHFFLNFQWIHWSEMTVLYLYLVVWGVTD